MDKLLIVFSILIIVIKTAALKIDYYDEISNGKTDVTTESESTFAVNYDDVITETSESSSDDIINLNVGGQRITTLRSTLTVVPNSKLAILFSKNNTDRNKPNDKENLVYFLDYNPQHFQHILDHLRNIKHIPQFKPYELDIEPLISDTLFNSSYMIDDLGLLPDRFLSPLMDTHLNLNVDSLIGWKKCYHSKYSVPFDVTILKNNCTGKRLLVACRSTDDKKILKLAGVGRQENLFSTCPPNSHCNINIKNNISFYYVENQVWGFIGRTNNIVSAYNPYQHNHPSPMETVHLNPCDSNHQNPEYRLCWSLRSNIGRGGGDRCGIHRDLHNANNFERLIYQPV